MKLRFLKKLFIMVNTVFIAFHVLFLNPVPTAIPSDTLVSISQIVPFSDIIFYKYRTYRGKRQKRRWNDTKKKWVDPYWIDCN